MIVLLDTGDKLQNTLALNEAIDDAHNNGGGEIYIDSPQYEVTYSGFSNDMVNLRSKKNITIRGRGTKLTTFLWDEDVFPVTQGQDRYMFSTNEGTENLNFRDFSVNGKRNEIVGAGNWIGGAQFHVFNIFASRNVNITGIDLYNCLADAVRLLGDIRDNNVVACHITNCGRSGISIQGGTRIRIADNVIVPPISDQAIDLESPRAKNHVIIENNWLENGSDAKVFAPIATGVDGGFHVRNNTMIGDVFIYGPEKTTLSGNSFISDKFHIKYGTDICIRCNYFTVNGDIEGGVKINGNTGRVVFESNTIHQAGPSSAMYIEDIPDLTVRNNGFYSLGESETGLLWVGAGANNTNPIMRITGNTYFGFVNGIKLSAKAIWTGSSIHILEITNNLVYKDGDVVVPVIVAPIVDTATVMEIIENNIG